MALASIPPAASAPALVVLNSSNNSPTSEALKDLLAVKVRPFTVTVSPLCMALKVMTEVEGAELPRVKDLAGVGSMPFLKMRLKAAPPLT